ELETGELESGRDRAADQRPVAEGFCRLPGMRRHHCLRTLAGGEVASENEAFDRAVAACCELELERAAGVIVPDFGGVDAVPVRALATRQQEIDRGRMRAAVRAGVAVRFHEVAALGMRLEAEQADDLGRVARHQNLFFRVLISANTAAAGAPAMPTAFATS